MSIKQDIQRTLTESDKPLSILEIAKRLGRKKSTWFSEQVVALWEMGVLERSQAITLDGGRPPYMYSIAKPKIDDFRREWQEYCEHVIPVPYELFLEAKLRECRGG